MTTTAVPSILALILSTQMTPVASEIRPTEPAPIVGRYDTEVVNTTRAHFVAPARELPVHVALARLRQYSNWGENWDGEGSEAPQRQTIEAASNLLGLLSSRHFVPHVGLNSLGQPMFLFSNSLYEGEIVVEDASNLSYFIRGGIDDDYARLKSVGPALPRRLEDILRARAFIY